MVRDTSAALFLVAALSVVSLPAAAQDTGGVRTRDPAATLSQIDANRGCPSSATSVTVGVNKATGNGSAAQQRLTTAGANGSAARAGRPSSGASPDCHPLVSTQVVTGVNLGLGRRSTAGQTIDATGRQGALATTTFTRGVNEGFGAGSTANQTLSNQTHR